MSRKNDLKQLAELATAKYEQAADSIDGNENEMRAISFLEAIIELSTQNGAVLLHGYGEFKIKDTEAGEYTHPRTGEKGKHPSRRHLTFNDSPTLTERLTKERNDAQKQ